MPDPKKPVLSLKDFALPDASVVGPSQARFTRTPIKVWQGDAGEPEGSFNLDNPEINVLMQGPNRTLADLAHVISHESIHAALSRVGGMFPTPKPPDPTWKDFIFDLHLGQPPNAVDRASEAWNASDRVGPKDLELPAYLGAFKEGQLPGLDANTAKRWMDAFLPSVPEPHRTTVKRIMESYQASQQ